VYKLTHVLGKSTVYAFKQCYIRVSYMYSPRVSTLLHAHRSKGSRVHLLRILRLINERLCTCIHFFSFLIVIIFHVLIFLYNCNSTSVIAIVHFFCTIHSFFRREEVLCNRHINMVRMSVW